MPEIYGENMRKEPVGRESLQALFWFLGVLYLYCCRELRKPVNMPV